MHALLNLALMIYDTTGVKDDRIGNPRSRRDNHAGCHNNIITDPG